MSYKLIIIMKWMFQRVLIWRNRVITLYLYYVTSILSLSLYSVYRYYSIINYSTLRVIFVFNAGYFALMEITMRENFSKLNALTTYFKCTSLLC